MSINRIRAGIITALLGVTLTLPLSLSLTSTSVLAADLVGEGAPEAQAEYVNVCGSSGQTRYYQIPSTSTCLNIYGEIEALAGYISLKNKNTNVENKEALALYRAMVGADTSTQGVHWYLKTSTRIAAVGSTDDVNLIFERALLTLGSQDVIKGDISIGYDESQWSHFTGGGLLGNFEGRPAATFDGYYGFHRAFQANYIGEFEVGQSGDFILQPFVGVEAQRDTLNELQPNPMVGLGVIWRDNLRVAALGVGDYANDVTAAKVSATYFLPEYRVMLGGWYGMQFGANKTVTTPYVDGKNAFGAWAKFSPTETVAVYGGYTDSANSYAAAVVGAQWEPEQLGVTIQPEVMIPMDKTVSGFAGTLRMFSRW